MLDARAIEGYQIKIDIIVGKISNILIKCGV